MSSVVIFLTTRHCKKSLPRQGAKKGHEEGLGYKLVLTGKVPSPLTSLSRFNYYETYPSGKPSGGWYDNGATIEKMLTFEVKSSNYSIRYYRFIHLVFALL